MASASLRLSIRCGSVVSCIPLTAIGAVVGRLVGSKSLMFSIACGAV